MTNAGELTNSTLTLTADWQDLGGEIEVGPIISGTEAPTVGSDNAALWINLDINDSKGIRFRILNKEQENDANEYLSPIIIQGRVRAYDQIVT